MYNIINVCPHCGNDNLSQGSHGLSHCWECGQDVEKVTVKFIEDRSSWEMLVNHRALIKNLSPTQRFTYLAVLYANNCNQDAYLETGRYKSFNTNSILSLARKGLIEITDRKCGSIYYARVK